jgi:hypothetical protein
VAGAQVLYVNLSAIPATNFEVFAVVADPLFEFVDTSLCGGVFFLLAALMGVYVILATNAKYLPETSDFLEGPIWLLIHFLLVAVTVGYVSSPLTSQLLSRCHVDGRIYLVTPDFSLTSSFSH